MDYLTTASQITGEGYPIILFYSIAIIGLILIMVKPFGAFIFGAFALSARNYHAAVFTRLPGIGRYLNLNDLLLWICLLALLRYVFINKRLWTPRILTAVIIINVIGALFSILQYGFISLVLQSIWAALIFPVMFLIAANLVIDEEKAKYFYWAIFGGALLSALQHLFFIKSQLIASDIIADDIKMISYIMSGGIFLACGAIFINMRKIIRNNLNFILWLAGISIIAFSYILSLTRTVWVGSIFAIIGLCLFTFKKPIERTSRQFISFIIIIFIIFGFSEIVFPALNIKPILSQKVAFLFHKDVFDDAYYTRAKGIKTELGIWLNSPIIFGVGTTLPPNIVKESTKGVGVVGKVGALGHVGFSTYLAKYGLVGLFVYWILLPILTIKIARKIYRFHPNTYLGALSLAATALAFYDIATIFSGHYYLYPTTHVEGLIYGSLWGISIVDNNI